jgi:hypothetical protein
MHSSAQDTAELLKRWKASRAEILVDLARGTDFSVTFVGCVTEATEYAVQLKATSGKSASLRLSFRGASTFEIAAGSGIETLPDLKITYRDDLVFTFVVLIQRPSDEDEGEAPRERKPN